MTVSFFSRASWIFGRQEENSSRNPQIERDETGVSSDVINSSPFCRRVFKLCSAMQGLRNNRAVAGAARTVQSIAYEVLSKGSLYFPPLFLIASESFLPNLMRMCLFISLCLGTALISIKERVENQNVYFILLQFVMLLNIPYLLSNFTGIEGAPFIASSLTETSFALISTYVSARLFQNGLDTLSKVHTATSLNKKIIHFISASILCLYALYAGILSLDYTKRIIEGLVIAATLERPQLDPIAKAGALSVLSHRKTCNALILDGLQTPDLPELGVRNILHFLKDALISGQTSIARTIYKYCDTLSYQPKDESQFRVALLNAKDVFEKQIENLILIGHGTSIAQFFGQEFALSLFNFTYKQQGVTYLGTNAELFEVMDASVIEDGHILSLGCNTATVKAEHQDVWWKGSFAEHLAKRLPNRYVYGINAYMHLLTSYIKYEAGRLFPFAYMPLDEERRYSLDLTENRAKVFRTERPDSIVQKVWSFVFG